MNVREVYDKMMRNLPDKKLRIVGIHKSDYTYIGLLKDGDDTDENVILYHSDTGIVETMHIMRALVVYNDALGVKSNSKNLLDEL